MGRKNRCRGHSVRRAITGYVMVILVSVVGVLVVYNLYSVNSLRQKIYEANQSSLAHSVNTIEQDLLHMEEFLLGVVANSTEFARLQSRNSELDTHLISVNLGLEMEKGTTYTQCNYGYAVLSQVNGFYRAKYKNQVDYQLQQEIRSYLEGAVAGGGNYGAMGWWKAKIGTGNFLFRCYGAKGNYAVAIVKAETFDRSFFGFPHETQYEIILGDLQGTPLVNRDFVEKEQILLEGESDSYLITGARGGWMLLGDRAANTELIFYVALPNVHFFGGMDVVQGVMFCCTLLAVGLIPLTYCLIKRWVVKPLNQIVATLTAVREGDFQAEMETNYRFQEFREVGEQFNSMMGEISRLKIATLEKEILRQKAELQYLYLQIKPHFFLNCLKNIYGMAQKHRYALIQDMTIGISNHFRYIMEDNSKLIPVEEEIEHIRNYISLQQMTNPDGPECEMDADSRVLRWLIPPLAVQTFVENCMKYGISPQRKLQISIHMDLLSTQEGDFLDITVEDNGEGFPQDLLKELNQPGAELGDLYSGRAVGIQNVKQRLRLIYGDQAVLAFDNGETGAVCEIIVPKREAVEQEEGRGETL